MSERQRWRAAPAKVKVKLLYEVFPVQVKQLEAFQRDWTVVCQPRVFNPPVRFLGPLAWLADSCFHLDECLRKDSGFEDEAWESPYAYGSAHAQDSRNGSNSWLDRFLFQKKQFLEQSHTVVWHAQTQRLRNTNRREVLEDDLQLLIKKLAMEYAALFALTRYVPAVPLPDPSAAGRDTASKWYAQGGGFRVYSSAAGRSYALQDPGRVQTRVLQDTVFAAALEACGRRLFDVLPGVFAEFNNQVQASLTTLAVNMRELVADVHGNEQVLPARYFKKTDKATSLLAMNNLCGYYKEERPVTVFAMNLSRNGHRTCVATPDRERGVSRGVGGTSTAAVVLHPCEGSEAWFLHMWNRLFCAADEERFRSYMGKLLALADPLDFCVDVQENAPEAVLFYVRSILDAVAREHFTPGAHGSALQQALRTLHSPTAASGAFLKDTGWLGTVTGFTVV
jgi:hypothetical protein